MLSHGAATPLVGVTEEVTVMDEVIRVSEVRMLTGAVEGIWLSTVGVPSMPMVMGGIL